MGGYGYGVGGRGAVGVGLGDDAQEETVLARKDRP